MKKTPFALVLVAAAFAVPGALAQPQTTKPTLYYEIRVKITDTDLVLTRRRYARDSGEGEGHIRLQRGVLVTFIVKNFGKKPHAFYLGGLQTPTLNPGAQAKLKTWLRERGSISYRVTLNAGPKQRGFLFVY